MSTTGPGGGRAPLLLTAAVFSHPGPVRKVNEDAYLDASDIGLWVVADGMGGHEGGQLASRMVIDCLDFDPDRSSEAAFVNAVADRLREANRRIQAVSHQRFEGRAIGSTVVVVLIHGRRAICLWAGDSRFYLLRDTVLRQVNDDHSHVADLVARGLLAPEKAATHPLRNVVTRAVGARKELEIDRRHVDLRHGDTLLLCTDGLNKVLSDEDIRMILTRGTCERAAGELIRTALARAVTDNVTVCVVRAQNASGEKGIACPDPVVDDPTIPLNRTEKPNR